MGPGYFPLLLGIALAVLGAVLLLRSLRLGTGRETLRGSLSWRPAAFVGAGVIAFALLAQEQGLLLATLTLTLLSGLARRGARLAELLGLSAALSAFGVAVFSFGLGLPLPILPR
ncbi:tripartite tricarboxylate transporter TctB family protein [Azotobacter sp. CWF10]